MARNKAHKQRFSSNRTLADKSKGRTASAENQNVKKFSLVGSKDRAKQVAESLRDKRRKAALDEKRIGSVSGCPRIVGVLPANESANSQQVVQGLTQVLSGTGEIPQRPKTYTCPSKKAAFTILHEDFCDEQDCLDIAKVSDFIILTLDASKMVQDTIKELQENQYQVDERCTMASTWFSDVGLCITDYTRDLIRSLNAQGIPGVVVALQNLNSFNEKRHKVLKVHQRYFLSVLPDTTKVVSIESDDDYSKIIRHLQESKLRSLKWRDQRPYLAIESLSSLDDGKLGVFGFLRGSSLSSKQLLHLTNFGTFQIESISTKDPKTGGLIELDKSTEEKREQLAHVQPSATLDDEGLPTEDDVAFHQQAEPVRKIRVPAGVSDYQASWYNTEDNLIDDEEARGPEVNFETVGEDEELRDEMLSYRTNRTDVDFLRADDVIRLEKMTDEEHLLQIQKLKEAGEDEAWNPDVVDTPINIPARQRFAKYRGLKGFQSGHWDPTENLPTHYGYIYKLQGFSRIKAGALAHCSAGPVPVGTPVFITLVNVPCSVIQHQNKCIIASGQLEHEQKWSVLHYHVQRSSELDEPIKSKTPMLAHIGFRKFYVSPLFSDASTGDRTKFARYFLESEKFRIATFFGPISYNPCPILLFQVPSLQEQAEGDPLMLACFGGALPPNPDLLILKRAVLTGRVAVIHKKQIVVKYMFFNEDDVKWFKPVDLYTKLGRIGKIIKPVGTHGLFKAALNDQVMQHDVICMDLYKRVYPKWTTIPYNVSDVKDNTENVELDDEELENK